jgi:hypothetical protein
MNLHNINNEKKHQFSKGTKKSRIPESKFGFT